MVIHLGHHLSSHRRAAFEREWLVTNGIGGYACGTVGGARTRRYHSYLTAAIHNPIRRYVLLAGLDVWLGIDQQRWPLTTHEWKAGVVFPDGYIHLERFDLDGTLPVWTWAIGMVRLQQRVWMHYGENTTYVTWTYERGRQPITLYIKPLITYRSHHDIGVGGAVVNVKAISPRVDGQVNLAVFPSTYLGKLVAEEPPMPFYILAESGALYANCDWWWNFHLAEERARGLSYEEDLFQVGTIEVELEVGETFSMVCALEPETIQPWQESLEAEQARQKQLISVVPFKQKPSWIEQLILAADQFIVQDHNDGEALHIISGYPWFGVWGRYTMASVSGLASELGQQERARQILLTFTRYLDRGMLPHHVADETGETSYDSIDATLWYFVAIWNYWQKYPKDTELLQQLYPVLAEIVEQYRIGARYHIAQDPADHLLYGGEEGINLTWMDVKINDYVVTPRVGKPVEVNALWYNALCIMEQISKILHLPEEARQYGHWAKEVAESFNALFWAESYGYLYDVIDTPTGNNDASLRPNQLLALSLPFPILEDRERAKQVVNACADFLLTPYGLRTLQERDINYVGSYKGNFNQREYALHQGTVWAWLIGPFIGAYWYAYQDIETAYTFLEPFIDHLTNHGLGTISEIFDGNAPHRPRGAFAFALSVAEILRVWAELERARYSES